MYSSIGEIWVRFRGFSIIRKRINPSVFFNPETLGKCGDVFLIFRLSFENGSGEVLTVDLQILGQQVVVEPFPNDRLDGTKNEELVI